MVTGDAVNVAARLEQTADAGADPRLRAHRALRARASASRRSGPLELRGKSRPRDGRAVDDSSAQRPARPSAASRACALRWSAATTSSSSCGRLYERGCASEGRPQLVTIYGDPGVGQEPPRRASSSAWAGTRGEPAARRCAAAACRTARASPTGRSPRSSRTTPGCSTRTRRTSRARTKVATRSRGDADPRGSPDPAARRRARVHGRRRRTASTRCAGPTRARCGPRSHAAWRAFFTALARRGPLVVVVEDIHWADEALLDLLEELADRAEGGAALRLSRRGPTSPPAARSGAAAAERLARSRSSRCRPTTPATLVVAPARRRRPPG